MATISNVLYVVLYLLSIREKYVHTWAITTDAHIHLYFHSHPPLWHSLLSTHNQIQVHPYPHSLTSIYTNTILWDCMNAVINTQTHSQNQIILTQKLHTHWHAHALALMHTALHPPIDSASPQVFPASHRPRQNRKRNKRISNMSDDETILNCRCCFDHRRLSLLWLCNIIIPSGRPPHITTSNLWGPRHTTKDLICYFLLPFSS